VRSTPDAETKGRAGEAVPLRPAMSWYTSSSSVAHQAVSLLFQSHQGRVADEDGGVGAAKHGVQVAPHRQKGHVRVTPVAKQDAGVSNRRAASGRGHRPQSRERLAGAAHQQQRPHPALGAMVAARQDAQAGGGGQSGDGISPMSAVPLASRSAHSEAAWSRFVARGQPPGQRRVLEIHISGAGLRKRIAAMAQAILNRRAVWRVGLHAS